MDRVRLRYSCLLVQYVTTETVKPLIYALVAQTGNLHHCLSDLSLAMRQLVAARCDRVAQMQLLSTCVGGTVGQWDSPHSSMSTDSPSHTVVNDLAVCISSVDASEQVQQNLLVKFCPLVVNVFANCCM